MNELLAKYPKEIESILAKYPAGEKRSAVMPLLHLAQREQNAVSPRALAEVAEICEVAITEVASIVGFYTLYYDQPLGRYHIQVCTDLPCALRGAEEFLAALCERLGVCVGEPSPDGFFIIEEVKCLAACHRAPVFQVHGPGWLDYYEDQTIETALAVIETLRAPAAGGKEGQG